jgi:hypothetical protein
VAFRQAGTLLSEGKQKLVQDRTKGDEKQDDYTVSDKLVSSITVALLIVIIVLRTLINLASYICLSYSSDEMCVQDD